MTLSDLWNKAVAVWELSHAQERSDRKRGALARLHYYQGLRDGLEQVFPRLKERTGEEIETGATAQGRSS